MRMYWLLETLQPGTTEQWISPLNSLRKDLLKEQSESSQLGRLQLIARNGNVAIDIARMLSRRREELEQTDIPTHVLDILTDNQIQEVRVFKDKIDIIARRGVVQSAFTLKELRQLSTLQNVRIEVSESDFDKSVNHDESQRQMSLDFWVEARGISRRTKFIQKLLVDEHSQPNKREVLIKFRYFFSPISVREASQTRVDGIEVETTELEDEAGQLRAVPVGTKELIPCDLLIYSIGFKTEEINGIPFNPRKKVFLSEHGYVENDCYVAGWAKTGARGVLDSTLRSTVETFRIFQYHLDHEIIQENEEAEVETLLSRKKIKYLTKEDWKKVEEEENRRGELSGKSKQKILSLEEMLSFLKK